MRRAHSAIALLLLVVALCGACTTRAGAPTGESAWREQADKTLGAALTGLGTARVVLENAPRGRLPHPYAVVTLHDAITGLEKESGSFLTGQPPDDLHADNQRVVDALGRARTLLVRVSTALASPGLDEQGAAPLLTAVKDEYDAVEELRTEVGP